MNVQVSFQIVGLLIVGLCCFYIILRMIVKAVEDMVKIYFAGKMTYVKMLEDMASPNGFKDMLEALAKKHKLAEKDV